MRKSFLILSLLTLIFGTLSVANNSFALTETEENYVDSLAEASNFTNCNSESDSELLECMEAESESYVNECEEESTDPESACYYSAEYVDSDETTEGTDEFGEVDDEIMTGFEEGLEETVDDSEASALPVLIVSVIGIALIIVLNLADRKK